MIVGPDIESDYAAIPENVRPGDWLPLAILLLVNDGLPQQDLRTVYVNNYVLAGVEVNIVKTVCAESDLFRRSAWCNHEVVFQLLLIPIEDNVHARIDLAHSHPFVMCDITEPLFWIIAEKVVALTGLRIEACH